MADKKRKPKPGKKSPSKSNPKKPEKSPSLKAIYAKLRKEFSAADLQKYTVDEPMLPARELLAELVATQKKYDQK